MAPPRRRGRRDSRARRGSDRRGAELPAAIDALGGWADVAAAWRIAAAVGAPLADSLRAIAHALTDAQEAADEVRAALAEPAGAARLMGWLPLITIGLGAALGFDTIGVLIGSPAGWVCLLGGLALVAAAQGWTRALVRRARGDNAVPGLDAELLAIALSGGASIDRATGLVTRARDRPIDDGARAVLDLSRAAGAPAVELLRASAGFSRHRVRAEGKVRAARLSTRLLIPLGVCTLPAFVLLGVIPLFLGVVGVLAPLPLLTAVPAD
ncbi:pilus assembly protein TadB [Microbacterium hominis]|uniref:pilus assembly protein TadB n=1 Tax=Microbacterium hominis TaxID=162426 RepID=UPI0020B6E4D8|nr:pilus assembly protein TadB [Microbacterium hominis]